MVVGTLLRFRLLSGPIIGRASGRLAAHRRRIIVGCHSAEPVVGRGGLGAGSGVGSAAAGWLDDFFFFLGRRVGATVGGIGVLVAGAGVLVGGWGVGVNPAWAKSGVVRLSATIPTMTIVIIVN